MKPTDPVATPTIDNTPPNVPVPDYRPVERFWRARSASWSIDCSGMGAPMGDEDRAAELRVSLEGFQRVVDKAVA